MQVLKKEIQNNIIESAKNLFINLGFEKTSMEKIARQAGISKSNLYNYYKSKDELFDTLADSAAYQFEKLIDFVSENKFTPRFGEAGFEQMIADHLFKLIDENKDGLILLMLCASGTKHEGLRTRSVQKIADKFRRDYSQYFSVNDPIVDVITDNFFAGIINLTVHSATENDLYQNLSRFIRYHSKGFFELVSS